MLMPTVRILVDHIFALVKLDTVEMEKNAQISTNVKLPSEFVMSMPFVRILLDLMFAPVKLDSPGMVKLAQL